MKKNSAKLLSIVTIISIIGYALILAGIFASYFYQTKEVAKKHEKTYAKYQQLLKDANNIEEQIKRYQEDKIKFEQSLFTDEDISTFLKNFSKFASDAGVQIVNMRRDKLRRVKGIDEIEQGQSNLAKKRKKSKDKTKDNEDKPILASMAIKVQLRGDFFHIMDFLVFLENYRQLLSLTNIAIKQQEYPMLICDFNINLYSLKAVQEIEMNSKR